MDGIKTRGKKTLSGFSPQAERKFSARGPRKKPPEAPSMVLAEEVLEDDAAESDPALLFECAEEVVDRLRTYEEEGALFFRRKRNSCR